MNSLLNVLLLRIKLTFRNKAIIILLFIIALIFVLLLKNLYMNIEESTEILIGFVDESNSDFSNQVKINLEKNDLICLYNTNINDGIKKIKKGELQLMMVIPFEVEEKIHAGEFKELFSLYYMNEDYFSPLIGELIIGGNAPGNFNYYCS